MKVEIESAANGFIVTPMHESESFEVRPQKFVVENKRDDEIGDIMAARDLLYGICEELGINTSRKRPHIVISMRDGNEQEIEPD